EILITSKLTNELFIFINDGSSPTPNFTRVSFAADLQPIGVLCADLNGDGRLDIAIANHLSLDFSVYYQTTPGSLDERFVPVATGAAPSLIEAGDVDGDGVPEIVVPNSSDNTVTVYARDPIAGLAPIKQYSTALPGASLPFQARVADVTGDGKN